MPEIKKSDKLVISELQEEIKHVKQLILQIKSAVKKEFYFIFAFIVCLLAGA
jgi:hypothetical protein